MLHLVRLRDDRIALGDKGRVTATADPDCRYLHVRVDGLMLRGEGPMVRASWRGDEVRGRLVLDESSESAGETHVAGTFTADDGTAVPVEGGIDGEAFFTTSCPGWSGTAA